MNSLELVAVIFGTLSLVAFWTQSVIQVLKSVRFSLPVIFCWVGFLGVLLIFLDLGGGYTPHIPSFFLLSLGIYYSRLNQLQLAKNHLTPLQQLWPIGLLIAFTFVCTFLDLAQRYFVGVIVIAGWMAVAYSISKALPQPSKK